MAREQTVSRERLAELNLGLERINEVWTAWNEELGEVQQSLEQAGIAAARFFSAVAGISSEERVHGNRSTRDLLRGFRTSGYLKSIKQRGGDP